MKPLLLPCLLALFLSAAADEAKAGVVFSNLNQDVINSMPVANNPSLYSESTPYVGSSFTVGTQYSFWSLDSVTMKMDSAPSNTTGAFSVAIYADTSDTNTVSKPGALIGTLTGVTPGSGAPLTAGEYVYNVSPATITLTAGSTYWLVASAPSTSGGNQGYNWDQAGTDYTASTGWSIDPTRSLTVFHSGYDSDSTTWYDDNAAVKTDNIVYRNSSATGPEMDFGLDGFMQFSLSASQYVAGAPEPSKSMFAMLGLFSLGVRRTRRR